jgi:hypothetical protein
MEGDAHPIEEIEIQLVTAPRQAVFDQYNPA